MMQSGIPYICQNGTPENVFHPHGDIDQDLQTEMLWSQAIEFLVEFAAPGWGVYVMITKPLQPVKMWYVRAMKDQRFVVETGDEQELSVHEDPSRALHMAVGLALTYYYTGGDA